MSMNNDDIYRWIVSHSQNYPGKHQDSRGRVYEGVKPLDPVAQFHLVIRALGEYITQNLCSSRGINYRGFGAFAFEVDTDLVKPAQLSNFDITKNLESQRDQRMHNHKIRLCFVPDSKLQQQLLRYPGKEQVTKPKSQHSIYQKGFNMIFCNAAPIANACCIDRQAVEDSLAAFAKAVIDLTSLGRNMCIRIGKLTININNRNLKYNYQKSFENSLNNTEYEKQMKKSLKETKSHWTDSYNEKWNLSKMGSLIMKPEIQTTSQVYNKGLGLKIMSLDMNSTEVLTKNKNRQ